MTRKDAFAGPLPRVTYSKPPHPQSAKSFRTVLSDDLLQQRIQHVYGREIPKPTPAKARPEPGLLLSLLNRVLSSLRGRGSVTKQLRLLEMVPLGEKRFVALVYAEGHRFLIGGGSSGVSLLTRLDEVQDAGDLADQSGHSRSVGIASLPETINPIERSKSFVELAGVQE